MVPQIENLNFLEIVVKFVVKFLEIYTVHIQVVIWLVCNQSIPGKFCWKLQLFVNMKPLWK